VTIGKNFPMLPTPVGGTVNPGRMFDHDRPVRASSLSPIVCVRMKVCEFFA
jgi:hypothetical protein